MPISFFYIDGIEPHPEPEESPELDGATRGREQAGWRGNNDPSNWIVPGRWAKGLTY